MVFGRQSGAMKTMGYDVHSTRAKDWFDADKDPISLEAWTAYIASDSEMKLEGEAKAIFADGGELIYANEGLAVWTAYSGHGLDANKAWFDHRAGCITVKNPDDEIIGKMKAIAVQLGAHVQGDDGESY